MSTTQKRLPSGSARMTSVPMPLLWVIALDLRACFTNLLRDHEIGMVFDDLLDLRVFVAGDQQEAVALPRDAFVLGGMNLDRRDAGRASAFAVERQRCLNPMLLRALLD